MAKIGKCFYLTERPIFFNGRDNLNQDLDLGNFHARGAAETTERGLGMARQPAWRTTNHGEPVGDRGFSQGVLYDGLEDARIASSLAFLDEDEHSNMARNGGLLESNVLGNEASNSSSSLNLNFYPWSSGVTPAHLKNNNDSLHNYNHSSSTSSSNNYSNKIVETSPAYNNGQQHHQETTNQMWPDMSNLYVSDGGYPHRAAAPQSQASSVIEPPRTNGGYVANGLEPNTSNFGINLRFYSRSLNGVPFQVRSNQPTYNTDLVPHSRQSQPPPPHHLQHQDAFGPLPPIGAGGGAVGTDFPTSPASPSLPSQADLLNMYRMLREEAPEHAPTIMDLVSSSDNRINGGHSGNSSRLYEMMNGEQRPLNYDFRFMNPSVPPPPLPHRRLADNKPFPASLAAQVKPSVPLRYQNVEDNQGQGLAEAASGHNGQGYYDQARKQQENQMFDIMGTNNNHHQHQQQEYPTTSMASADVDSMRSYGNHVVKNHQELGAGASAVGGNPYNMRMNPFLSFLPQGHHHHHQFPPPPYNHYAHSPLFNPFMQMRAPKKVGSSQNLHAHLELCYEQFRQMEKERKQTEARLASSLPGRHWSSANTLPVPKLPHNPSRVDRLIIDNLREHSRVLTLVAKMEALGSHQVPPTVHESFTYWMEAIKGVQECRRAELESLSRHHNQLVTKGPAAAAYMDDRFLETRMQYLSVSIRKLYEAIRRARTSCWCTLISTILLERESRAKEVSAESAPSEEESALPPPETPINMDVAAPLLPDHGGEEVKTT